MTITFIGRKSKYHVKYDICEISTLDSTILFLGFIKIK